MTSLERTPSIPATVGPPHRRWDPSGAHLHVVAQPYVQGALALTFPPAFDLPAPSATASLSVVSQSGPS